MNFGEQIKRVRTEHNLTQEQFADQLLVTRQAVSNWENERNLPDIEMLIIIAETYKVSLDELILGGKEMNNMTEKLIRDGSEVRRARFNTISMAIGAVLLIIGMSLLAVKALSVEYVDASGILHENFFLVPMGFGAIFAGGLCFLITGVKNIAEIIGSKDPRQKRSHRSAIIICGTVIAALAVLLVLLVIANH